MTHTDITQRVCTRCGVGFRDLDRGNQPVVVRVVGRFHVSTRIRIADLCDPCEHSLHVRVSKMVKAFLAEDGSSCTKMCADCGKQPRLTTCYKCTNHGDIT